MGYIEREDLDDVLRNSLEFLKKNIPVSKNDILVYIIVFCQLLNCIFYKPSDVYAVTSAKLIIGKSKDERLLFLFNFRNAICHAINTNTYSKSFKLLCDSLNCNSTNIDSNFISCIVDLAYEVINKYCKNESSFMGKLSELHD